jgi:hypothetical protein
MYVYMYVCWREVANKLNKQSWTADKRCSSSLGLGVGLTPQTLTDSLYKRPRRKKMGMRFSTLNVRSMCRAGSLRAVAEEISKY